MTKQDKFNRLMDAHRHVAVGTFERMAATLAKQDAGMATPGGENKRSAMLMQNGIQTLSDGGREHADVALL